MKRIFFILGLMSSLIVKSQSIKEQILENVSEIKSINLNDGDFSDLEVIGDAIGKAKIVFLGEQDHGDATTFEAKTRLVKYLHEKKGFNVLAFESDFFNINKKSDEQKPIEDIEESIFHIWSNCIQVNPLFEYIKGQQKMNPLIISGFDCQIGQTLDEDKNRYLDEVTALVEDNVNVSKILDYPLFKDVLSDLLFFVKKTENKKAHFKKVDKKSQKKFYVTLDNIKKQIKEKETFLFKSLENIEFYAKSQWDSSKKGMQARDFQMGQNILWLSNTKFSNEKIIVWAASSHLVRKLKNEKGNRIISVVSAGEHVCNQLDENNIYSIAFTSRKGYTHRTTFKSGYKVKKPKKESIESWIFSKQFQYAFVNFKEIENKSKIFFNMKGISHYSFKSNWLEAFDGVFYIDEMFPCIREK